MKRRKGINRVLIHSLEIEEVLLVSGWIGKELRNCYFVVTTRKAGQTKK